MTGNNNSVVADSVEHAAPQIDASLRAGLALLRQAHVYAMDAGADVWDFAVENDHLYATGLTISDLRWLVAKTLAQHGQETSFYGDAHRSFRRSAGLNFMPTTCFVLTPEGVRFADRALQEVPPHVEPNGSASQHITSRMPA
jgi:hypothetical protein